MHDLLPQVLGPLLGQYCWSVERVHGSMISLEFGTPHLSVREPHESKSPSPRVRERMSRRRVRPVGEWCLMTFDCHWRLATGGHELAHDECDHATIGAALRKLDGEKITGLALDPEARATTFGFDLGSTLTIAPVSHEPDGFEEQWSLYCPNGNVLSYRTDGCFAYGPETAEPAAIVWRLPPDDRKILRVG